MSRTAITSRLTTGLVALVAGYASFTHIYDVAREAGERASVAAVLPLSIDGLILVGTLAMLDDKRNGRKPRLSARLAVAFGVVATLAANIASAQPTITARLVAAVSPVAFLLAVEVLSRRGKLIRPEPVDQVEPVKVAEPVAVERVEPLAPEPVAEPAEVTLPRARLSRSSGPVSRAASLFPARSRRLTGSCRLTSPSRMRRTPGSLSLPGSRWRR